MKNATPVVLSGHHAAREAEYSPRWPRIHAFIERELARDGVAPDYKRPEGGAHELDAFLMETVMEPKAQPE